MTKLSNIRPLGRYKNTETGKEYNIKKGRNAQRGTDVIFYLYRNNRVIINDRDFYTNFKKVTQEKITKFNPENKKQLSYGQALDAAMHITNEADAEQYLKDYIAWQEKKLIKFPDARACSAEYICKYNLHHYSSYYADPQIRTRVEKLFHCSPKELKKLEPLKP